LRAEQVGVDAAGVGLTAKPDEGAGDTECSTDGITGDKADGASSDSESKGGQGPPPRLPGEAPKLVCSVRKGLATVRECLFSSVVVKGCEIPNEMAEITDICAVFGTVLTAEIKNFIERYGCEIESDLLKVERDAVPNGRQRRHIQRVEKGLEMPWSRTDRLQCVASRFSRGAQELREHDEHEGTYGWVERNGHTVFAVAGKSPIAKLFEDDLGQASISGATEP
jgi:hypothetical protein